jgi:hypothetical protein
MKITLLLSIAVAVLALTGCGQNVEQIQSHYTQKTNTPVESFDGYLTSISRDEMKKIKEFKRSNRLPNSLKIEDDLSIDELPDLDFDPDEYDEAQKIRKEMLVVLEGVKDEAKASSSKIMADYKTQNAALQIKVDRLESEYAKYTSLIAKEQADYDAIDATLNAHKKEQQSIQDNFLKEIRKVIISEGLPIDASSNFQLTRQYERARSENNCLRLDKSYPQLVLADKSEGCVYINRNEKNKKVRTTILGYGAKYENSNVKESIAYNERKAASKLLKNAKIIAKNQTGINIQSIERDIASLKRKISRSESSMKYETDIAMITRHILRENEKAKYLAEKYREAEKKYEAAVMKKAFANADIEFDTFSDENDEFEPINNGSTLVIYVFTSESGSQDVGITSTDKMGLTYAELFEGRVQFVNPKETIDSEDDIRGLLSGLI